MSDFIQSFIARRREEEKMKKGGTSIEKGKNTETARRHLEAQRKSDGVIRTYKDIIELKPRKTIVREFFRQSVAMLNQENED